MYTDSSDQGYLSASEDSAKTWYTMDIGQDHKMQIKKYNAVQCKISN